MGKTARTGLLAALLVAAVLPARGNEPEPDRRIAAIDGQLQRGEWEPARAAALALIAEDLSIPEPAPLAGAVARLALAEAGLGREADALWHWHAAQNLDRAALSPETLAAFGAPGKLLAGHPLRRADEAPAGLQVFPAEKPGIRSSRRLQGSIPPPSAAAAAVPAARVLRLQAVVATDGRLLQPVVLAGSSPGVTWEILEALRGWRYESARQRDRPVAVFRALTIQLPGGGPSLTGNAVRDGKLARVEGLLRSASWAEARESVRGLWRETLEIPTGDPQRELATFLMMRAVAEAGLGMEAEAVCRWQAAQYVEPRLRNADLSAYGPAGRLLEQNPREPEENLTGERAGKAVKKTTPEYPQGALRALAAKGKIVLGATIGPAGAVRQPRVLRVETGGKPLLTGLDASDRTPAVAFASTAPRRQRPRRPLRLAPSPRRLSRRGGGSPANAGRLLQRSHERRVRDRVRFSRPRALHQGPRPPEPAAWSEHPDLLREHGAPTSLVGARAVRA